MAWQKLGKVMIYNISGWSIGQDEGETALLKKVLKKVEKGVEKAQSKLQVWYSGYFLLD